MKRILLLLVWLLTAGCCCVSLYAESATNPDAVKGLLDRIGGSGTSDRFVTIVNDALSTNGKDVFVITSQDGKPCIKGNSIIAVTTGINWYLNHYAHVNIAWNQLTTDLSSVTLPVPTGEDRHTCSADLRYYLNYCTYSYSCALWTTERWLQEIDWMALHGINMPLMLVGLDAVWYDLYTKEYSYTAEEVSKHVAGPAFQAWWGMINVEGHGGPNPKWWYERSRALCQTMLKRMRSFGMEPVLPGFAGAVPNDFGTKSGATEVNNTGTWQGITAPGLIGHKSNKWTDVSTKYYKYLKNVMGTSKYYAMDVNHEGGTYLDSQTTPLSYADQSGFIQTVYSTLATNVGSDAVWVAQAWGHNPSSNLLNNVAAGKLMILDLFGENDPRGKSGSFGSHNFIYCMLHNFGGRIGLHGRFDQTMDNYYASLTTKPDQCKGIGATPEGIETNPMLYDMLYELPWMDKPANKFDWVKDYTTARYGQVNAQAQNAYDKLYHSVYNCTTGQQGTSEPIVCARPSLTATSVSTWSTAVISHNTDFVIEAADDLLSQVATLSGNNYNYDLLDVTRQALTDYAMTLLQQLNTDWNNGGKNNADFAARAQYYLSLIDGLDQLLGTHQSYRFGNWAEMARAIAKESAAVAGGAGESDADWLEYDNLRRQVTTWDTKDNWSLKDYSNREWQGMLKDYYKPRWVLYFDNLLNGTALPSSWYSWENDWVKNKNNYTYSATPEGDTKTIAQQLFNTYFWSLTDRNSQKVYVRRHVEQMLKNEAYNVLAYRGESYTMAIPEGTTCSSLSIDLNNDGAFGEGETVASNTMSIPADAAAGLVKVRLVLNDNTVLNYQLALADNITEARTVSVSVAEGCESMGAVSIDGAKGTSVNGTDYLTIRAHANQGYDFIKWSVKVGGQTTESTDNPYLYYGKEAAELTASFVQSIWGVPTENWTDGGDIRNNQFLTGISYTQDEITTDIYSASTAPATLFNTAPTMIQVAKGSSFQVNMSDAGNMGYCNLSAYIDLNQDGDFDDEGELVTVRGNKGSFYSGICNDPVTVLLPYDIPTGVTHLRLRFDGAWKTNYDATTKAFPPKAELNRMCYEVLVNVLDKANHATHIVIKSEDTNKGTVRNITGVTGEDINVPVGTQICMEAFPKEGYKFKHWEDKYGRVASTAASFYYYPAESGEFTARFESIATLTYNDWKFAYEEIDDKVYITRVDQAGSGALDMTQANSVRKELMGIAPTTFQGNTTLTSLSLPASCAALDYYLDTSFTGAGTQDVLIAPKLTIPSNSPWQLILCATTNGASFNEWGSSLLATGSNSFANSYENGFQLYWAKAGKLTAKVNGWSENKFSTLASAKFTIIIDNYGDGKLDMTLYADDKEAETKSFTGVTFNDISTFSSSLPTGINITKLFISDPTLHNKPFRGCTAVEQYAVEAGNAWYVAIDKNLCNKHSGDLLAYAEGKLYQRAYTLKNASDSYYATTNPPADANGAIIATDYNNTQRVVSTAADLTPAALVRFAKVSGKNEIFHLNSGGFYGGKSGTGGNGQQIEVLAMAQWAGDYTLTKRSEFNNDLVAEVSLACNGFNLASSEGKFILSNTAPADGNASVWQIAEATSLPVTVSEALWTALCLPVDVVVPEASEAEVYVADAATSNKVTLRLLEAGTLLKAGEGVIIHTTEAKTFSLSISYAGTATQDAANVLSGATARRTGLTAKTFYGLGNKEGVAFYLSTGTEVPANKSYLLASRVPSGSNALAFDFGTETGIGQAVGAVDPNEVYYDLRGRRVLYPSQGVFVTSKGEKVYIK